MAMCARTHCTARAPKHEKYVQQRYVANSCSALAEVYTVWLTYQALARYPQLYIYNLSEKLWRE